MAAGAVDEARSIVSQLAAPIRAEHNTLADPEEETIGRLEDAVERARWLSADSDWAAVLDDGIIDLESHVTAELARRMKSVMADADRTVRASDPGAAWDEFGTALARRVSEEVSAVAVGVGDLAGALAAQLAEEFAEHEAALTSTIEAPLLAAASAVAGQAPPALTRTTLRRLLVVDAGWGGLEAMGVMGSILAFTSISLFNPFSLVIGVFIGGKTVRDARRRDVERRRDQASEAVAQYLRDAQQAADRDSRRPAGASGGAADHLPAPGRRPLPLGARVPCRRPAHHRRRRHAARAPAPGAGRSVGRAGGAGRPGRGG